MLLCEWCAAEFVGLALDTRRQKLYYTDQKTTGGKVGELSTDGTAHRVVIFDHSYRPRAVVFDENNRWSNVLLYTKRIYLGERDQRFISVWFHRWAREICGKNQ